MNRFNKDEYLALKAAYAQGVSVVRYGDKTVEYRSLAEMKKIMSEMELEIQNRRVINKRYIRFSKGVE